MLLSSMKFVFIVLNFHVYRFTKPSCLKTYQQNQCENLM